jgi:predicted NAD/FAD-dependent oxidoreductase
VDVVVVGAGLSGLSAAHRLQEAGLDVVVLERDRWVGGRLGTRLVGPALVDHGAQFFTTRNRNFAEWVDVLLAEDLVYEWCRGFGNTDGYPRFVARGGMAELARILAREVPVRLDCPVRAVIAGGERWQVVIDGEDETTEAAAVLLTAPVPQSLRILEAGGVALGHDEQEGLPGIEYVGPFSFVADNEVKGLSEVPALTLHASAALSSALWNESDSKVIATLLDAADEYIGDRQVRDVQLTRWEYATPKTVWTNRSVTVAEQPGPLLLAGDSFGGPRVEGAWLSGDAAAATILKRIGIDPVTGA